ncbi:MULTISPECIES: hypothetical protein [unclassified Paenibacillus]|uniref:hypothetical protein n=1 Tax=unclassified Paenibacillus TaxID=185978 RepID=UPI0036325830
MRVSTNDNGITVIDQDEAVVALAAGIDTDTTVWSYVDRSGQTVTIDISAHRPNLDVLSGLYRQAEVTKRPEVAAAYISMKSRILVLFDKRDRLGERYE